MIMKNNISHLQKRNGESSDPPFRSGRYFCVGNRWYFTTREGFDSGPYSSKQRAETGLNRFLRIASILPSPPASQAQMAMH